MFTGRPIELVTKEEFGRRPLYGRALDIGTGSGTWGTALAQRGWDVTGIDTVEKAIRRARSRVATAGVGMALGHGGVTTLTTPAPGID